ncbi:MAG: transglutaminase, partial [Nocardioides sp.]|nr:transglutaminase [Nocardioides sp.]
MSVKVALSHRTTYDFAHPVAVGPHVVRLRPAPHTRTPIEAYSLTVEPENHFLNWQQDPFGNWMARLVFPEKVTTLDITVGLVADLMVINPFDFFVEEYAERFPFVYESSLHADLFPYLRPVEDAGAADAFRRSLTQPVGADGQGTPIITFLAGLNAAVNAEVAYSVRMEAGVQSPDETLARRIGSCRDSAWLLVALLRQHGLAARFVSGYLVQLSTDPDAMVGLDGPSGPEQDFTDLHAWAEVYLPGAGWVGFDATSGLMAGEGHIPLAASPEPASAAAISGLVEPAETEFDFAMSVTRVRETPRVTKPYAEDQWQAILAQGLRVDRALTAVDVRLTMGGEPTFIAADDM